MLGINTVAWNENKTLAWTDTPVPLMKRQCEQALGRLRRENPALGFRIGPGKNGDKFSSRGAGGCQELFELFVVEYLLVQQGVYGALGSREFLLC